MNVVILVLFSFGWTFQFYGWILAQSKQIFFKNKNCMWGQTFHISKIAVWVGNGLSALYGWFLQQKLSNLKFYLSTNENFVPKR